MKLLLSGEKMTQLIKDYEKDAESQSAPLVSWKYVPHRAKFLVQVQLKHILNLDAKTTTELIVKLEARLDELYKKVVEK